MGPTWNPHGASPEAEYRASGFITLIPKYITILFRELLIATIVYLGGTLGNF